MTATFVLLLSLTACTAEADSARAGEVMRQADDDGFTGVVLVDVGGEVTVEGMGHEPDARLDIGSLTKQFTAAAVLALEEDGLLSVDDRLGDHLNGLPPDKADLTLHQALTHTTGLPDSLGPDTEPIGRDAYVERVASTPLEREPGEYGYSNVGYSLLAAVVETVTGLTYEEYLRTALFEPAGLHDTGYDGDPYWNLRGNGGLLSTAHDMHRWIRALADGEVAGRDRMLAPHVDEGGGTHYGYGWVLATTGFDTPLVTHNGGDGVSYAELLWFPEDDVVLYLATDSARESDEELATRLAGTLFDTHHVW